MNRRSVLSLSTIAALGLVLLPGSAGSQQMGKSLKEQLVGTWALVSFDSTDTSGAKVAPLEG
jgi:hypothetical protein